MRYFLIVGEASGDLHASHLLRALKAEDPAAEFYGIGGDLMAAEGCRLLLHYRELAFMGFLPVLLHLPTLLRGLRRCQQALREWQPDGVILVDYPGFNLRIARYVKEARLCPVYYYIAPKLWAWKEYRIEQLKRYVDGLFSILPFEKAFFEGKHGYRISYVGNPTVDEVAAFRARVATSVEHRPRFYAQHRLSPSSPLIALLAGSRQQEIRANLLPMCLAAQPLVAEGYQLVVAAAPSLAPEYYEQLLSQLPITARPKVVYGATYDLLHYATVALVTSGTATLETALFDVPQVVCYHVRCGRLVNVLRRWVLKVPFVSLVNLVAGREVVPELVAGDMTVDNVRHHLRSILPDGERRQAMLEGYAMVRQLLGESRAAERTATEILQRLHGRGAMQAATP